MKTEMAQLQEALSQEKAKHERYVREMTRRNVSGSQNIPGSIARASISVRGSYTTDSEWDREEEEKTTTPKTTKPVTTPETNTKSVPTEFLRVDEEHDESSEEPETPVKCLLTSTVSLGDTVESHASLKVEFDALGGDEDSEFEDSSPLRRNDDVETVEMKVDDDVEFESPKGSTKWKKWSRRDGQTENGDVIVTSSPVSSRDNEEFSLNNSASSRIMKHEMRVLDVDEGNATDDNPDRGFGSTDEFKDGDGDITTTDLDMSGEFLGGGVTTGTWCSSARTHFLMFSQECQLYHSFVSKENHSNTQRSNTHSNISNTGTSLQSTDFDVSDVTSVTALSNASVSVMDSGSASNIGL